MNRTRLVAIGGASLMLGAVISFAAPSARSGSKPTPSQKARKAEDSVATKRAKAMQKVKAAQTPADNAALAGTWAIDPVHSLVGFSVRHVLVNDVHGSFNDFEGTITADPKDITKCGVEFSAKVASIDTRQAQRDGHLKSPDFFDAEKYPELTFKSTSVQRTQDGYKLLGTLTMHGVSKPVSMPFQLRGPVVDGFRYTRIGLSAKLDINRQDYGVKWNQTLDKGGLAVDNIVHVNLDLEAVKAGTGPEKKPE